MVHYGISLLITGFIFSGFVSCHAVNDAARDARRVANLINSVKTAPIVKQNSPAADQKSSVTRKNVILTDPTDVPAVETNVVIPAEANMPAVDIIVEPSQIDSSTQKNKLSDSGQSNTLSTAENTPSETITSARASFIVPTNNIQLPESGSVVAVESSPNEPVTNGQSFEVTEKVKELVPSPAVTSSTMNSIGTSKQSISSTSAEATPGQTTASESSAVTLSTDAAVTASDVTTVGFNSTQGTIAPTVTNIVDKSTDDGVIVFKSNENGTNKQAGTFITTTTALTTDALAITEKNTTPKSKTTLNVIKPTTSGTTELAQTVPINQPDAAEAKVTVDTVTEAKADPKPAQDNVVATMTTAEETTNMASLAEEITNDKTTQTASAEMSKLSGDSMISTKSDPTATKISTTMSALAREYNAQTTEESQTKQPVSTSTVGTSSSVTAQTNEVTCPDVLCTGSCKYGRKRDTRGCETCQCNFSAECPKPVPTTRLLCMMQLRLGQSCRSDADCPLHRICCPGTCGQSCRRRSSTRSRVLSMLKNL